MRHVAHLDGARTPRAPGAVATERHAWQAVARRALRIAAVPLAALAALVTGAVFVVLLPVCGIASIAEAMMRAAWRFVSTAIGRNVAPVGRSPQAIS